MMIFKMWSMKAWNPAVTAYLKTANLYATMNKEET